ININYPKFFGTIFTRWVQAYNFFSGINVAASADPNIVISGSKLVENARVGRSWNYGPLGGFVNVDLNAGYRFTEKITLSAQITNLFNTREREFVGSPFISRLFSVELRYNF
ncbi:MAG: TonB-dependent receptor, partial [Bacteroidota bacterium]